MGVNIKFGTSGWRAVISDEFTFDNVRLVTQAIANYLKKRTRRKEVGQGPKVIIGYDTRFLSKEFAQVCAQVLAQNKIKVLISNRDMPTPVVAYHIIKKKASGGINFTASHNPPEYNGIKFSPQSGAPAPPEVTKKIEAEIKRLQAAGFKAKAQHINSLKYIKTFDPKPAYFSQIRKIINFAAIKKANLKIAADCLYGTAREYLDYLLKEANCETEVLRNWLDPYFEGRGPEPAEDNIKGLIDCVKKKKLDLGLACDGDADRFGITDSDGTYISANQVISLLLYHLIKTRVKKTKPVAIRTVATTHMVDAICEKFNVKVHETPVGFKYFAEYLIADNCIIAGEESGGLSISGHVPEKDGILACLLVAEMVALNKKPLKKLLASLHKEFGYFYFKRVDLHMTPEQKNKLMNMLAHKTPKVFASQSVTRVDKRDGCKLLFKDASWALFRPSGTEPIVRCYFEARTQVRLKQLIVAGNRLT